MNTQLTNFRAQVDDFMGSHPQSPLDWQQKHEFKGLSFYNENDDLILEGELKFFPADEPLIEMSTNTGDIRPYRRWGQFPFTVDEQEVTLTIYSDLHEHEFFLPFKDTTNGSETYGAGRYLDNHRPGMQQLSEGSFRIDFNYAYNPYCAYSPAFSCPLPPPENWLKVPIPAGEKKFK